jgi:cytoplasmic iron level regulating protein YaaA (DUF328/UPF0246 family)
MGKKIVLVACVSQKHEGAMPAWQLYCSTWFEKARVHAQRIGDEWYILSAKYGLVAPKRVIAPYNLKLSAEPAHVRKEWAIMVASDLEKVLHVGDRVVLLAGESYRENLIEPIKEMGCSVEIPMEGLRFGEQLRWLSRK